MRLTVILNRRLGKMLSELARREQREKPVAKGKQRFRTFQVPPDAPVIRASGVQRVLDDEGWV